jgi:GNAT superfamily N-acetyltransferase
MDTSCRRALLSDAGAIAQVHVATWRTAYRGIVPQACLDSLDLNARKQNWAEWLGRDGVAVFVAEAEGRLCGFIAGGRLREPVGDCDCEIYAIYVLADAQRRRIGSGLMSLLASDLAAKGFARPAVWVLAANPSRHFYTRLGAQPIAEKPIEIGGVELVEVAYGWENMDPLLGQRATAAPSH